MQPFLTEIRRTREVYSSFLEITHNSQNPPGRKQLNIQSNMKCLIGNSLQFVQRDTAGPLGQFLRCL